MARTLQALLTALVLFSCSLHAQNYTGLTGFYDYQTHGRTPKHLAVNPANGYLHAIFMSSPDSSNIEPSRRTNYAYSTNGGMSWNTFGNIWVPVRRSGFPSLTLGQGPIQGAPIIVNQCSGSVVVSIDFPEGGGAFAELNPVPLRGDSPFSPDVASGADGSVLVLGVLPNSNTPAVTRTTDYEFWSPPLAVPASSTIGDRFVVESNETGRVGIAFADTCDRLFFWESTNNGITWPAFTTQILPNAIEVGHDTLGLGSGLDLAYNGNNPLVTFGVREIRSATDNAGIGFWSRTTGFVLAAPHNRIMGVANSLNRNQANQFTVGYPSIGMSGNTIVIVFQAFAPETSATGFNYGKIFFARSSSGGTIWYTSGWDTPLSVDARYPSMSKWNPSLFYGALWQVDPEPGSFIAGDNMLVRRVWQTFNRPWIEDVPRNDDEVGEFRLLQNYPNPFNPSTIIKYQIPIPSWVTLNVLDLLGRELATLVNEEKQPGTYTVQFDGRELASGVYFYRLHAGNFIETKKIVLLK
jgi:hypothetical protein